MTRTAARRAPPTTIESSRDRERLRTVVFPEHSDLAAAVAERIVEVIHRETRAKGRVVLGLATGSTPLGVYEELIRRHQAGDVDFSRVITFNLDEYYPMTPDSPHSYHRYMWENFFAQVNIAKENVHIPDGTTPRERVADACAAYEEAIRAAGGIDFQLLGIGKTGHVGFNEPGSDATSRTRIVMLDTLTRKDAAADFFGVENVPREALTMGVATILDAREIALLATGEHKAAIVARAVEGEISTDVAATFLQRHQSVTCYLDLPAAADLTRIKTPWILEGIDWTPAMVERAAESLGLDSSAVQRARSTVNAGMEQKAPGDVDIPVVQNLKKFIRESEAIAALAAVGIPANSARFLDLPFYRTGEVRKRPLSEDDIAIVLRLIEETRPDLVFVAGDLSDPHGTHRTCKAAVERALEGYKGQQPEVWLYRGAWQEWSLTEADVLVPLSQDELHAKILAIFRHQSQKDTAPFPGYDEREFWQRVEARNLETAARADRLGLPEYYAMEAYVIQRA